MSLRTSMRILCLCALSFLLQTSSFAQIFPVDRNTAWTTGVVGGIPARATICATINASTYTGVEASAGIQAALDSCTAGQTVKLSAGDFQINNLLLIHTGITLRGSGPGVTRLIKRDGARARTSRFIPIDPGSYSFNAQPVVIAGPQRYNHPDNATSQAISTDAAKAAFTATVASGTGFAAGQIVLIDELSGATWQSTPTGFPGAALVWRGDRVAWNIHLPVQMYLDDTVDADATGPYFTLSPRTLPPAMSYFSREDRPTNEMHEIASVAGNVLTFTTPLHITYRTSHTAQVTRFTGADTHIKLAGIEDLTTIGGADGSVRVVNCANCWVKHVEVTQWIGEGVAIDASYRVELRDSYIHEGSWPEPGGGGYAISLSNASTEVLIENNISYDTNKVMVFRSSGAGSVVGYNYTDDGWIYGTNGWQEVGINASHMAGPHHVLFEGNDAVNFDSDYTHGNAVYLTVFRNRLSGQRRSFTDTDNQRVAGAAYGSWWLTFIGNVLGRSGQVSTWNYEAAPMTGASTSWQGPNIYQIGYDPERFDYPMVADPTTLSTLIRDGNYDFKTNSQQWITTPATFTIPNSLYLAAKPAFFGSNTWPWTNPATGATSVLPAKARFDAGVPNDVSTSGPGAPTGIGVNAKPAQPTISNLSVSSGPVGTTVTITGTGFAAVQGTGAITFNGVPATATSWSALGITTTVPTGATTGNVIVTQNSLSSTGTAFTVSGGGSFTDAAGGLWVVATGGASTGICPQSGGTGPCTMTRALAAVASGGTIILNAGTYTAGFTVSTTNVTVTASAAIKNALTWTCGSAHVIAQETAFGIGSGSDCGIVSGTDGRPLITGGRVSLAASGVTVSYLRIRVEAAITGTAESPGFDGIVGISADNTLLDHNEIWNENNQGVFVDRKRLVTISYNNIHDLGIIPSNSDTHGVFMAGATAATNAASFSDGIVIRGNTIGPNVGGDSEQEASDAYGCGKDNGGTPVCALNFLDVSFNHMFTPEEQCFDHKGTQDVRIHSNDCSETGQGGFSGTDDPLVRNKDRYDFYNNYIHDMDLYALTWAQNRDCTVWRIWNNVFARTVRVNVFNYPAVQMCGDTGSFVVFNTFYLNTDLPNNTGSGFHGSAVKDWGSGNNIRNNIFYSNGQGSDDRGHVTDNGGEDSGTPVGNYMNDPSTASAGVRKIGTSVTTTCFAALNCPGFTSIASNNYLLLSGSPARGAGAALSSHISLTPSGNFTPNLDALGFTRPTTAPDDGAYQFQ